MAFATLSEVQARIDWTLSPEEERITVAALDDATVLAKHHGLHWEDSSPPAIVKTIVLQAVVRYVRNPDGYTQSRAGDETLGWTDRGEQAAAVAFTENEIRLLRGLAGQSSSLVSAELTAWNTRLPSGYASLGFVPTGAGDPFPMYPTPDSPW